MQRSSLSEPPTYSAFGPQLLEYPRDKKGKAFLKRVFHRRSTPDLTFDRKRRDSVLSDASTIYVMMPSPNTHPLLVKPTPRDELLGRFRGQSHQAHAQRAVGTQLGVVTVTPDTRSSNMDSQTQIENVLATLPKSQKGSIASSTSTRRERDSMQNLSYFTRCYAEGRFNLSNPPEPPLQILQQNYFPAPLTPTEEVRLEAVRLCKAAFGLKESNEKCKRLVDLANKVFQTGMGAISFIDDKAESFHVGGFMARSNINRMSSIGAHVLLSTEPMIVLNTAEDWRFRGMQIVKDSPGLLFYAGAPLVNADAEVVGVFAVFDTQARDAFTMAHRRKLMDFAKLAMTEIESAIEERENLRKKALGDNNGKAEGPEVPILTLEVEGRRPSVTQEERDLVRGRLLQGIEAAVEGMQGDSRDTNNFTNLTCSGDDIKPRVETPNVELPEGHPMKIEIPRVEISQVETPTLETPQTEKPWGDKPKVERVSKLEKPKVEKAKLEKPKVEKPLPLDRYAQPGKLKVRVRSGTPRLDPLCNCGFKNAHTAKNHSFAVRDVPSPPLTPSSNRPFSMISSVSGSQKLQTPRPHSFASSSSRSRSPSPLSFVNPFAYVSNGSSKASKRLSHQISVGSGLKNKTSSRTPVKNHTEAEFAISIIARSLGFDLVYLLRMGPIRSDMAENELVGHGIYTQVLVSHGMPKPEPVFDGSLHLRALRSHGGLIYSNPNQAQADDGCGYQLGILLPLHRDNDGLEVDSDGGILCRAGTVLCAYTRAVGRELYFAEEEVRLLRDFGEAMRDILLLADPDHGSGSEVAPHSQFRGRMASI